MDNNSVKTALPIILCLLLLLPAKAQGGHFGDRYTVLELNMEQGLPCNYVDDVFQDSMGFLWIATSGGGVCRWDGYDLLTLNTGGAASLKSNFTRVLAEDPFLRLWVASEGGLDILDLNTLEAVSLDLPFSERGQVCSCISLDAKGNMWVKMGAVLYRIAFDGNGAVSTVLPFSDERLSAVNMVFRDVDKDGSVWIPLEGRLYKVQPSTSSTLVATPIAPELYLGAGTYVSDFLVSGASVWISTENGLFQWFRGTGEWKQYVSDPGNDHSLTQNFVSGLALTPDGQLLASSLHGLNVFNPVSNDFERVGGDVINCLKVFGERLLVATETKGLLMMSPTRLDIVHYAHRSGDEASLSAGPVNAIYQQPDGQLWVGTVEGGLNVREKGTERFRHLTREQNHLAHNSVSALCPGEEGELYVGTWGGGIDRISLSQPHRILSHLPSYGLQTDYIGVLQYDRHNRLLWIGSNRGIFLWDPVEQTYTPALDIPVNGCIGSCLDSSGHLWIGIQEGLVVFDLGGRDADGHFPYIHYRYKLDSPDSGIEEKICCILEAADGDMYLGGNGNGLYHGIRQADGSYRFTAYTTAQGLSNDRVRGLCRDGNGRIWISTDHGLNLLDPTTGRIVPFQVRDGLANAQFHWNNACQGTDGLLYFGHADGFSAVNPLHLNPDSDKGPLRLTRVDVGEHSFRNPHLAKLHLHERDRSIVFSFAALIPNASDRISYRYWMEGFDKDWRRVGEGRHEVAYSSLPGGNLILHLQAVNRFGEQIDQLTLPVEVKPHAYRRWWFKLIIILFVAALVWAYLTWKTHSLKRRQQVLEETVRERTREISAQKKLVEEKAEELKRQNELLQRQNEELASRKILFDPERQGENSPQDKEFVQKALQVVRQFYKDPELDVAAFCQAMGASKTLLNKRLQDSVGAPIGQFIRRYRLAVAREMLENNQGMNVSEIAYEVGFNDPKYFTRCFAKEFGITPSSLGKED